MPRPSNELPATLSPRLRAALVALLLLVPATAQATDGDGDGLSDADEVSIHGTDPGRPDTDGDGFSDGEEVAAARDPLDPASGPPPTPVWDYAMPSRFVVPGADENDSDDFVADVYTAHGVDPVSGEVIFPDAWTVTFDACATGGLVFAYDWYVDGVLVESGPYCDGFSHDFPTEGAYVVRMVAIGTGGEQVVAQRTVQVLDHFIFGLGDSYASGEGNPDLPVDLDLFDAYHDALVALAQAQSDANAAHATWQSALAQWNDLVGRVNLAVARLNIWNQKVEARKAACPWPPLACAEALAAEVVAAGDLIWALGNVGIPDWNVNNLPSFQTILTRIYALYNAGLATYNAALSGWNAAQALVFDSLALVDSLESELDPTWQDEGCHRSAWSGQVRAAQRIEQSDPHSSVTFVHLACSGAQINAGPGRLIQRTNPGEPAPDWRKANVQVGAMRRLVGDDGMADAVFLSIGGNDIGFADIIAMCVGTEPCYEASWVPDTVAQVAIDSLCAGFAWFLDGPCIIETLTPGPGQSAMSHFEANLSGLPARYQELAQWFEGTLPAVAPGSAPHPRLVAARQVYLTEYPDFTRDESAGFCGWNPQTPGDETQMPGISFPEHVFASVAAGGLRASMMASADDLGWTFVSDISAAFLTHGYCATDPWVVRIPDSFLTQMDGSGMVHPTVAGHGAYASAIETHYLPEPGLAAALASGLAMLAALERRRTRR